MEYNASAGVQSAGPCVMVIFGAAGDLTKRLLFPSLYNLAKRKLLPAEFAVVGFARTNLAEEEYKAKATADLHEFVGSDADPALVQWLVDRVYYVKSEFGDPEGYQRLAQHLAEIDTKHSTKGNYFFYLATAPEFFLESSQQLHRAGLLTETNGTFRRLVVEKPFGTDLESAQALNREMGKLLQESQIYRIDHYLGKETVQNILVFRFANGIFEPIWNRRYIDHVQITVAETVGVEMRGGYYDTAGALRDMVPNHILQLVSLTAMEPPASFSAKTVHDEQVKVLQSIRPVKREDAVRGQYGPSADGKQAPYRMEQRVPPESWTETYAALKLSVDNWRWAGVPFYLRTGKRMPKRLTEVVVQFRCAPLSLFRQTSVRALEPNTLIMHIQPDEGISLNFEAKVPGPGMNLGLVNLKFNYSDFFGKEPRTGYETLLYDVIMGDPILFQRADMIEAGWATIAPILKIWKQVPAPDFPNYFSGSWGPASGDELLGREGRKWRLHSMKE